MAPGRQVLDANKQSQILSNNLLQRELHQCTAIISWLGLMKIFHLLVGILLIANKKKSGSFKKTILLNLIAGTSVGLQERINEDDKINYK